jgi:ferredoxin
MADVEAKFPENVDGPYYVDESCIACGVCVSEAPDHFEFTDDEDHAYVYRQPEDDDEEDVCADALESCPVDAIGDNG